MTKEKADEILPNVDVMILDSLLLHARLLIDFYTKCQPKVPDDDILLRDFSVSIGQVLSNKLARYKKPIEVHLFHLTDWRDREYRDGKAVGAKANRYRPDWNAEAAPIVRLIFDALKDVSEQTGDWQPPFRDLHEASMARYSNKLYEWPAKLGEKSDVEQYLKRLGL